MLALRQQAAGRLPMLLLTPHSGNPAGSGLAGGIARLGSLLEGYNEAADVKVTAAEVQYFEVLAAARWGAISLLQGDRFVTGGERSIELVLTGLMPPEMEFDALELIDRIENDKAKGRAP